MTKIFKKTDRVLVVTRHGYEFMERDAMEVLMIAFYAIKYGKLEDLNRVLQDEGYVKKKGEHD